MKKLSSVVRVIILSLMVFALETNQSPAAAESFTDTIEASSGKGKTIRLNFRGVPLEMVLDYLSEAAGFTILLEAQAKGPVDVWSDQPLDEDEVFNLLNT